MELGLLVDRTGSERWWWWWWWWRRRRS